MTIPNNRKLKWPRHFYVKMNRQAAVLWWSLRFVVQNWVDWFVKIQKFIWWIELYLQGYYHNNNNTIRHITIITTVASLLTIIVAWCSLEFIWIIGRNFLWFHVRAVRISNMRILLRLSYYSFSDRIIPINKYFQSYRKQHWMIHPDSQDHINILSEKQ